MKRTVRGGKNMFMRVSRRRRWLGGKGVWDHGFGGRERIGVGKSCLVCLLSIMMVVTSDHRPEGRNQVSKGRRNAKIPQPREKLG